MRNKPLHFVVGLITFSALLSAATSGQAAKAVSFPSTQTEAVSPNGQFAVISVDSDGEPYHTLFLENRRTKARRKLLEYGRSVEVLWSPDGTRLAVTDYAGSNIADCMVFSTNETQSPQNVANTVQKSIKNAKERADLASRGHIYWAAVRWTSSGALLVKVFGHTDENPSHEFQYFHFYQPEHGR